MQKLKLHLLAVATALCALFLCVDSAWGGAGANSDILAEVQSLYGLSEEAAIERLAAEAVAAEVDFIIRHSDIPSYAGSWFDPASGNLLVAIADPDDSSKVELAGGVPVLVPRSLDELNALKMAAVGSIRADETLRSGLVSFFVDVQANQAVIGVESAYVDLTRAALDNFAAEVLRVEAASRLDLAADVRAADGTRNLTWQQDFPNHPSFPFPCSIGASVVGGYLTAGHCGAATNDIVTPSPSSQALGEVADSTLPFSGNEFDSGWVDTVSGWTPTPKVNGYNVPNFKFSAKWAGTLESPIGSMVCRYGQTSKF